MALFRRRWGVRHLLAAWGAYWLALAVVVLWRPALVAWRMSREPDAHGSMSASVENSLATASIVVDGVTRWSGSAPLPWITFWLVGPPLLLWVGWLLLSRRPAAPDAVAAPASQVPPALHAPMPAGFDGVRERAAMDEAARTPPRPR
jgi:hypothetical protein